MTNLYCIHYQSDSEHGVFTYLRAECEEHAVEKFNRLYAEGYQLVDVTDCGELFEDR